MGLVQEAKWLYRKRRNFVLKGRILLSSQRNRYKIRGNEISMIFQEPMTALNPVYTVGDQIGEVFRIHKGLSRKQARQEALRMLRMVSIPVLKKVRRILLSAFRRYEAAYRDRYGVSMRAESSYC